MCTTVPTTIRNVDPSEFRGLSCPCCPEGAGSRLEYMRFLDPHGVERVDRDILECSISRHVFRVRQGRLRLVASDGARIHPAKSFDLLNGRLVPEPTDVSP
jgi:hypothetical protein